VRPPSNKHFERDLPFAFQQPGPCTLCYSSDEMLRYLFKALDVPTLRLLPPGCERTRGLLTHGEGGVWRVPRVVRSVHRAAAGGDTRSD